MNGRGANLLRQNLDLDFLQIFAAPDAEALERIGAGIAGGSSRNQESPAILQEGS